LWDNNILGESHWRDVVAELQEMDAEVDFNQGLDARLVTEEVASALRNLKIPTIRLAYDFPQMGKSVKQAVTRLRAAGLTARRCRHICSYVLYNYTDTPEDLFIRVRDLLAWGVAAYPMRYQPLSGEHAFEKDSYISPKWTAEELEMVAAARRVIGYGGAFPPYEGLLRKFCDARGFHDAFELRSRQDGKTRGATTRRRQPADGFELREFAWDLLRMGKDHQFPTEALDSHLKNA
jgi:hypothetical protein